MLTRPRTPLRAVPCALALALAVVAGCGDERDERRLLPRSSAQELRTTLASVEESTLAGDCATAEQAAVTLRQQVDALPNRVYRDLRDSLEEGADRLATLVSDRCRPREEAPPPAPEPAPAPEKPADEEPKEEDKPKPEKDQGKGKDEELPPGQEKKGPDEGSGNEDSGGTVLTPEDGGGSGEELP